MNTPNDPKGAAGALKTPLGLIPSYAMEQTAWVHKLGSDKYGPFNWRKTGVCASTYVNAILRHLNAWRDGETVDPESGISHLAHVACSCNILLDAGFCGTLQDDRNITPNNELTKITEDLIKKWDKEKQVKKMDKPTPIPYTEYRLLKAGELIEEGDEFFCPHAGKWETTTWKTEDGYTMGNHSFPYRRKVELVEEPVPMDAEYRLLEIGELIQDGDQFYAGSIDQWLFTNIGNTLTSTTGETKYRRKVELVPMDAEYRILEEEEPIKGGDQFYSKSLDCWIDTIGVSVPRYNGSMTKYRRKVGVSNEPDLCTCGRIKINHFMLGLICEDCEIRWQDPY